MNTSNMTPASLDHTHDKAWADGKAAAQAAQAAALRAKALAALAEAEALEAAAMAMEAEAPAEAEAEAPEAQAPAPEAQAPAAEVIEAEEAATEAQAPEAQAQAAEATEEVIEAEVIEAEVIEAQAAEAQVQAAEAEAPAEVIEDFGKLVESFPLPTTVNTVFISAVDTTSNNTVPEEDITEGFFDDEEDAGGHEIPDLPDFFDHIQGSLKIKEVLTLYTDAMMEAVNMANVDLCADFLAQIGLDVNRQYVVGMRTVRRQSKRLDVNHWHNYVTEALSLDAQGFLQSLDTWCTGVKLALPTLSPATPRLPAETMLRGPARYRAYRILYSMSMVTALITETMKDGDKIAEGDNTTDTEADTVTSNDDTDSDFARIVVKPQAESFQQKRWSRIIVDGIVVSLPQETAKALQDILTRNASGVATITDVLM